ncbi:aspartate carbamoyltransferase [Candidatus Kaiserbacteria bacterium CG10_big_fil_rev_8_21_14_0_10_49_17]|uniref:Aspartate carbamoyltransferase n=1 Tax=Candidatus Kaiserbacteria bacterium CG10_big_fil_rev_8_21_14_0_10_49_17 TaxID=1974609 RepID=A0A2M6WEC6_9BACT|nr:MAG: aspartate carbamoyltransferase [Candidatus Kaiserbacteria bacterium CG10_big_fil_rev_8_21_14_0_10_49_17]
MQHLIETQQFTREALKELFNVATSLEGKRGQSLKGKILASLFYEPSTRTRLSFESAMLRLGGEVITMENGKESSSQSKGETLEDSIKVVNHYADLIVMRHAEVGSAARAAAVSNVPIINAGDGNMGQHPTQALLDLYTIQRELKREDNIHIAIVGNLKYYRSPRSLAYLLSKYKDIKVTFISSPELRMEEDVKTHLKENNVPFTETEDMITGIRDADVVYQTRIAKEWIKNDEEYEKQRGRYIITRAVADSMKKGAIIIHPLPRVGEIEEAVDASPHAVYFKQIGYGLIVRMALLKTILGGEKKLFRAHKKK